MVTQVSLKYINMIKAFRSDCESLTEKFKKKKDKDFNSFLQLWRMMKFHSVYDTEISNPHGVEYDFIDDSLQIAKLIMLTEDFTTGMFLMYGLYVMQQEPLAIIRLEYDEFLYILRTLKVKDEQKMQEKNLDLLYVFAFLMKEKAFSFVYFAREYDMEGQHRALMIYEKQYDYIDEDSYKFVTTSEWLQNVTKERPKTVSHLDSDYLKAKTRIIAAMPYLNFTLDLVQDDLFTTLQKYFSQANSMAQPENKDDIGARRRLLKNRHRKTRHRYEKNDCEKEEDEDEDEDEDLAPPGQKRRGAPKGTRKGFFDQLVNDPMESEPDNGAMSMDDDSYAPKLSLKCIQSESDNDATSDATSDEDSYIF